MQRNTLALESKGYEVWSGDVKGSFWAYEIVDGTGSWTEPSSLTLVVRKDEDGKPLHDGIVLAIHCKE